MKDFPRLTDSSQNHIMHPKGLSFLISIYIWTFILVTILPLFVLYGVLWVLMVPFDRKKQVTHGYTVLWTRLYLTINPGWKIRVEGREKIDSSQPYIIVSNHQSIIDIALLLQLRINFKWVSKVELARFPFVGWVIWLNDHILVRRGDKQSVVHMAEACKKNLYSGVSVFMFPEGTRTRSGDIQVFKEGAFILAKDTSVAILPIVLDGASRALPKRGFWFRVNQVFTIRVMEAITSDTIKQLDHFQLLEYTRNEMVRELQSLRSSKMD
jgi:1-acyl-sn-glycerol-3-phosphate acyltransferase